MSALSLITAQAQFTATLKAVEDAVRFAFRRRLRRQEYEEALAEARAAAWSACHGLIAKGKDPVEVGVHGIATNAIRYVKNRRKLGNRTCGRGAMDVNHPRAQKRGGFRLISLDSGDAISAEDSTSGSWRMWLAEDNTVSPAHEACFRVDFAAWLEGPPLRKRRVAELLSEGHATGVAARAAGLSPGRVSPLRRALAARWAARPTGAGSPPRPPR